MWKKCLYIIFIVGLLWFFGFRWYSGYYPLPNLIYMIYYSDLSNKDAILIDDDFKFGEKTYKVSKVITSKYPLPHFLNLYFENITSLDTKSNLKIQIDIFRNGKLVFSKITSKDKKAVKRYEKGKPYGVQGLKLYEIPFPLEWKSYKDIKIEVTVLEPDINLVTKVERASLQLFPNIKLE